jgi:hypothetical protein
LHGDKDILGYSTNRNFLGILEVISQFDPFLKKHLETHGNTGKVKPSYAGNPICA